MNTLVLYSRYVGTWRASYYNDWLEAIKENANFNISVQNIVPKYLKVPQISKYQIVEDMEEKNKLTTYQILYKIYRRYYTSLLEYLYKNGLLWNISDIKQYDLIILLHSTNSNSVLPLSMLETYLKKRRGKLLIFVGNEYFLMPKKLSFINNVEADYICSQLPHEAATWLYNDCKKSKLLLVPHALNQNIYKPIKKMNQREIDIGFIGDKYPYSIGDNERNEVIEHFNKYSSAFGLKTKISIGKKLRIERNKYVLFLNSCRGTIGAESGTYYLEKTDKTRRMVEAYQSYHTKANFHEIYNKIFKKYYNGINGKAISSRHFEPIGTKSCQILLEGEYNGILKPNVHYISLKKDYSNMDEVIAKFKDDKYIKNMVDSTYEYVRENHTYKNRIDYIERKVREDP